MKGFYRILAFIIKELQSIIVQPQLLLLLVVGPFLVLLIFGLGYRPQDPVLQTVVVQSQPQSTKTDLSTYLNSLGPPLHVVDTTTDLASALRRLQARTVDLVVVVPPNIQATLAQGQNAELVYYHNAIDPVMVGYINAVVDGATSQMNRAILEVAIGDQQASAADYEQILSQLQSNLEDIHAALQAGDRGRALALADSVRLNAELVASLWLFSANPFTSGSAPAVQLAQQARDLATMLADPTSNPDTMDAKVTQMQGEVSSMLTALDRSRSVPASVLVSPLTYETKPISTYQPGYVAYHSPTVLALLVQHLCVTLAALSLVDERSAGALDLFRAAPVSAGHILAGKFTAYALVVIIAATALVALLIYGLHVPLLGNWRWFVVVMIALMAHSLNLGFLISAVSKSRSQAIQMSMLALLGSIFFSGFFSPLSDFALPVQVISYSLPVTYGIASLRQIFLRGETPQPIFLVMLGAWAVVLGFLALRTFRKLFIVR